MSFILVSILSFIKDNKGHCDVNTMMSNLSSVWDKVSNLPKSLDLLLIIVYGPRQKTEAVKLLNVKILEEISHAATNA